jgi:hypothetical protein
LECDGWGMTAIFVPPETAGWGRKCETGRCHGEATRSVLTKVRGDVFARFHAVASKRHSRTQNSKFGLLGLPQLPYRWRHQSGIFWIPPRTWLISTKECQGDCGNLFRVCQTGNCYCRERLLVVLMYDFDK